MLHETVYYYKLRNNVVVVDYCSLPPLLSRRGRNKLPQKYRWWYKQHINRLETE